MGRGRKWIGEDSRAKYYIPHSLLVDQNFVVNICALHPHRLIKGLEEAKVVAALQVRTLEGDLVCSRQKVSELVHETEGLKMTNEAIKK